MRTSSLVPITCALAAALASAAHAECLSDPLRDAAFREGRPPACRPHGLSLSVPFGQKDTAPRFTFSFGKAELSQDPPDSRLYFGNGGHAELRPHEGGPQPQGGRVVTFQFTVPLPYHK